MRACQPAVEGTVRRDGVEIYYERYGHGSQTIMLLPTWSLLHSHCWKMQIPYLARHYEVVTFDPAAMGAPVVRSAKTRTAKGISRPTLLPSSTQRTATARSSSASRWVRSAASCWRPNIPSAYRAWYSSHQRFR
jgi:hypothetical protein